MSELELFEAALEQPPAGRAAFLREACAGNDALRQRLEVLLARHDAAASFLEVPAAAGVATIERQPPERPGLRIGRYKLMEQIGEGGMGTVWVAEQTEPVRRRVALKLIKPGMDSRQVLSRFEAERQALALINHPNIAKVYDGGMTDEGRPFFVMEYVKGMPITTYCDNARLSIHDRLKLFIPVCQAVQHAHQKGVIHRDLKPSNILVCLYDGQPVPKVIDFGLAKAMHQPLTEHTLYTAHGLMVGTPIYMSPEQAEFNNLDVDTRSDIYSLGVILYELLTGTTPLEKKQFKDAALQEILRLIKEVEPQRPSLKLSTSASLPSIAAQRSLEPAQLSRAVKGDLDWIVMKSLEKERSRRYETANSLARDIERYLRDELVEARPPATLYKMRKFTRRNRVAVFLSLFVAASLVAVLFNYLLGLRSVRKQRDRAVAAEVASQENLHKLQQVAREWATSETLTGDSTRAEVAIRLAESAHVAHEWTEILRAQSELDQGKYKSAVARLTPTADEVRASHDARYAALALLAYGHLVNGHDDDYLSSTTRLRSLKHDAGPEALLFHAMAEAHAEPDKAIALADLAARTRIYPSTSLVRATALHNLAIHRLDYDFVSQALKELEFAEKFAGNTPAVLLAKLQVNGNGYFMAKRASMDDAAKSHIAAVAACLRQMNDLPRTKALALHAVIGYNILGDFEKAWNAATSVDWEDSSWIHYLAAGLLDGGESPESMLPVFDSLRFDADNPHVHVAHAYYFAHIPSRRALIESLYHRAYSASNGSFHNRYYAIAILALIGKPDEMRKEARELLTRFAGKIDYWGIGDGIRFVAGERTEQEAIAAAAPSNMRLCAVYYAIALMRMAAGDAEGTREYIVKCADTRYLPAFEMAWANAFVARMARDPNWPDWVEKKQ